MRVAAALTCVCLLVPGVAHAERGAGTFEDPIVVDAFPYVLRATTVDAPSRVIDRYACATELDESGPEVVFRFTLEQAARVTAWVEGDGGGVDNDVHLLDGPTVDAGTAVACMDRGHTIAEAEMGPGEHFVVVDAFEGDAQAGEFVLHLEAIGDAWIERPVARGVAWRARRYIDHFGPQVVHALLVDPEEAGVEVRAIASSGCQTVGQIGAAEGAVAGINGGYFASGCVPVSLLIEGGALVATNERSRGAFGMTAEADPTVEVVPAGSDWPGVEQAHGGGPVLAVSGIAYEGADAWAAEDFSGGFTGKHPRTVASYDATGLVRFVTVDGRRANAAGMSLDELASFVVSDEIGATDAVNLDGGGSTTMWIAGATPNGVVNYPSDAGGEQSTHAGARANSGGLFVFADPHNHPPRFQTEPVTGATVGAPYEYDADAIDLDVDDVVTFALTDGPEGMGVDAATGVVTYTPAVDAPAESAVVLVASDDRGASTEQSFLVTVAGTITPGTDGGVGPTADGAAPGTDAGTTPPSSSAEGGCGCRVAAPPRAPAGWLAGVLALAGLCVRRRRS